MLADEEVRRFSQRNRSPTGDDIAGIFRTGREAPIYAGISLGVLGVGLITGKEGVRRAGIRVATSLADDIGGPVSAYCFTLWQPVLPSPASTTTATG